ncbi:hypothetical protein [Streptomyces tauricus]|uniref:hypothetical protein n=1 Tax=Streptomyces tauricus TaxID=68274 RepID=UPI0022432DFC|nr:hypothetical protein [Streptomyces tauricus]MCW8103422.1 hypothetical protein [Streptomyces tauricus]
MIDGMLRADLDAPPKQRHTAQRIFDRLVEGHGANDVSYSMVRVYVKERRKEIRRQAGVGPEVMFVPQTHLPGAEAEVDFGDVHIVLAGVATRVYLLSLRLSYSGKAVHRVFASCGQEAFFEGHVHAFRTLGGIPRGRIRYDNLRAAVERVLGFSRARVETERWTAFRSHWDIDAFYCRPGIEGAHEKGGVEGQIGYFRRNHFVPVPSLNYEMITAACGFCELCSGAMSQIALIATGARSTRVNALSNAAWPCRRAASRASRTSTGSKAAAGSSCEAVPTLTARSSMWTASSNIRVARKSSRVSAHPVCGMNTA